MEIFDLMSSTVLDRLSEHGTARASDETAKKLRRSKGTTDTRMQRLMPLGTVSGFNKPAQGSAARRIAPFDPPPLRLQISGGRLKYPVR
jgi:hypothetical protein